MDDIAKKISEFNKRWGITDESTYGEEFSKFKTRVLNIFSDIDDHVEREGITKFCQILGIPEEWDTEAYGIGRERSTNIIDALEEENNEKRFYSLLEIIFRLPILTAGGFRGLIEYSRDILYKRLLEAVSLSKINLVVTHKGDEVILFPRGEEKLDQKLVEEVISFLNNKSSKHFIDALKSYEKGTRKDRIKSAESLRRALEEFLRFKLKNKQGLKKNIEELQKRLKGSGKDPSVRNIIFQTFSYLDNYFNENSKHKDGDINEPENEFLIYQTGLLMRYIEKSSVILA